jgi:ribonuclease Z
MTDLSVFFAGTAGSAPTARRGLPAVLVRRGGERLLFDCGEGTQRQLLRSVGLTDLDYVFLTHHHVDHWLGLLGMVKSFALRDRERPLVVYGPPGTQQLVKSMRGVIGKLPFAFDVVDLASGDELHFDEAGYVIHAFNVRHRGTAFGYSLVEHARPGRFDDARARALGVTPGPDFGRLQHGEAVGDVTPDQVVGPSRPGRRVVISGDTAPCDMVRVAAMGADLLVHEATFTTEERDRARETGHSTAQQAATLAAEAGVRMLALTHVSTRYAGREVLDEARAAFSATVLPRDFDTVEIPYAEKGEPHLLRWDSQAHAPAAAPEVPA